jgi:hypothetical protein
MGTTGIVDRTLRRAAVAVVVAGLTAATATAGVATATAAPTGAQGSLDAVSLSGVSTVEVRGWVSDGSTPTRVAVYVNSTGYTYTGGTGYTLSSSDSRPDVAAHLGSAQAGYGFDHVVPLPSGTHQVCAYALSQTGGPNPLLGCQSITAPSNPIGHVDSVEQVASGNPLTEVVRITGWVFDPDRQGGPGVVDTYLHSTAYGTTTGTRNTTTLARPDVATAYGLTNDTVGFSLEVGQKYGFDTARLYGINTDGPGTNTLFATLSPTNPTPPPAAVDQARATATDSCRTWHAGQQQNAADGSATLRQAARSADSASQLDTYWTQLASDMDYVSALPLTDNTPAQVAQAHTDNPRIQQTCGDLGITVSAS